MNNYKTPIIPRFPSRTRLRSPAAASLTTATRAAPSKATKPTPVSSRTRPKSGKSTLTLSDDFVAPQTPDPHWQVVDSKGNTYLLQKLMIKGDKMNKSIVVPNYVADIKTVQIWCAFAEVNLGEASFDRPSSNPRPHAAVPPRSRKTSIQTP